MKNQIAIFLATAVFASISFAQNTSTSTMRAQDSSSKGFRVSIVKPILKTEFKATFDDGQSFSAKGDVDETLGFAIGYASLPVKAFGWTTNVAYLDAKDNGTTVGVVRVDGNAAYAFSSLVNVKGGLNLSKITKPESTNYQPAIGLQANVGFQVTKNFGVDLGYTQMNQTVDEDDYDLKLQMSGFEVGVNGTF